MQTRIPTTSVAKAEEMICYLCYGQEPTAKEMAQAVNMALGQDLLEPATGGQVLQARMLAGQAMTISIPASYPVAEIVDDLDQRAAWPSWRNDSVHWRSHVIATIIGSGSTDRNAINEKAATLLRVTSAIASGTGASGVAWSGCLVFWPTAKLSQAMARTSLPTDFLVRAAWFGQPRPQGEGLALKTWGLTTLDLPEIWHPPTGEDASTIYNRVMNLAAYLIRNGSVLNDGDTFGATSGPTMRVRHEADKQGKVVLVVNMGLRE